MTYEQLVDLVLGSRQEDWLADELKGVFTLKKDLDVTIRESRAGDWSEGEPFNEPWAKDFPNPNAERALFELWYRASYVKTYYFVMVDGGRAYLPFPKSANDLTITAEQYAVADAVNREAHRGHFEMYLGRVRIVD